MKICILMPAHCSGRLGGAELQAHFLMRHLHSTTHHQVSLICRHSSLVEDGGVPIHRISAIGSLSRFTYLADYPSVQRLLGRINPDLIYTRVGSPLVGYAARYCKNNRKPLIHHIARLDDVLPRSQLQSRNMVRSLERRIYEWGLRQANLVIAQANYQAEHLKRNFNCNSVEVIPNYHPAPAEAPTKAQNERLVLWVANIKAAKRPEAFIELARRCSNLPDTRFMMVGAMSDPRYAPMIQDASRLEHFNYAGPAPLEEVNRLISSAHLFVNTSDALGEGFPNTFIQAWLRGTPAASLEVNPDNLLDGGFLGTCSSNSIDQLVRDVQSLISDRHKLRSMGELARNHAIRTYGIGNLERIRALLEQHADRSSH